MLVDSGNVELTTTAALEVGAQGSGRLILGSADAPGSVHAASALDVPVIVRATPEAHGLVQGWGTLGTGGTLINNGRIVADGNGQIRTLNLTDFARVENTIDNPPDGTNGWYAQNGGSLQLPPVQIHSGAYTWGESPTDPTLDLVNSLRITVHNQPQPAAVSITLQSINTDAETIYASPHVALPKDISLLSLYHVAPAGYSYSYSFGGLSQFALAPVEVAARYNADGLSLADGSEGALELYAYNGAWYSADSIEVDAANKVITGNLDGGLIYLAVGLPDQVPIHVMPMVSIDAVSPSTAAGLNTSSDVIPEPCAAILSALVCAGIIGARRRR
jgi:hypothetical protein